MTNFKPSPDKGKEISRLTGWPLWWKWCHLAGGVLKNVRFFRDLVTKALKEIEFKRRVVLIEPKEGQ